MYEEYYSTLWYTLVDYSTVWYTVVGYGILDRLLYHIIAYSSIL